MDEQRYPISVRLVGVMHKEKSKMYVTSVLWSDQADIVVYRTLKDFRTMHKKLKKTFPSTSKVKKSGRVIPKFQVKKARKGRKKGPSLGRLKVLQKYCTELLGCDPRVPHSSDLIQFFHPKDQDLQPEFARNSIMVMLSEEDVKDGAGHVTGGNVTQPFVTETYRCVAPYETKDTKNKPFKVAMDEKLDVLIKDKSGWWLVEREDKRMAWFPAPYLKRQDDDDDDEDEDGDEIPERGTLCTVVRNYKATKDDEMNVSIGVVVEVLQKSDNGWWFIRHNGKAGYVPSMHLQPYNYPLVRMPAHQGSRLTLEQSHQLSRSQGNLLQLPASRSSSPRPLQSDTRERSRSLNTLSEQPPPQPSLSTYKQNASVKTPPPKYNPPPTIMVEADEDGTQHSRSQMTDSDGSFLTSSSEEFSFSDDLSSSAASSTLNLSFSANDERLRLSRTPPPTSTHLSPTSGLEGKMMPSVSDPNLYKRPTTPKVPPRPEAREILTRCTTITRKNAARSSPTPPQTEILSR